MLKWLQNFNRLVRGTEVVILTIHVTLKILGLCTGNPVGATLFFFRNCGTISKSYNLHFALPFHQGLVLSESTMKP